MNKWKHQLEALQAMHSNTVGKIILPTGAGKSVVEFKYARSKLLADDGIHQIVIIVVPTIMLGQQLIQDFYKFALQNNKPVKEALIFASVGHVPTVKFKYDNKKIIIRPHKIGTHTTNPTEIAHIINNHKKEDRDTIILSTYASFDRVIEGINKARDNKEEIYLIADEAHRFVSGTGFTQAFDALRDNLNLFDGRYFLTATPKYCSNESSMDNIEIYGEVIYEEKPRALIDRGVICPPVLTIADLPLDINETNFDKHSVDFITKTFLIHEERINQDSGHNVDGRIGGKIIVTVKGSEQLLNIINNGLEEAINKINKNKKGGQLNYAWTMSHDDVGMYFNGKQCESKDDFLSKIQEVCKDANGNPRNSTRLIVFHYDQLTEGINVPTMTGAIFLREMAVYKIIQNTGRTLRAHPDDHTKDVKWRHATFIKPYSEVIIPNLIDREDIDKIITQFREEWNVNHFYSLSEQALGIEIDQPDLQNFEHKKKKFTEISEIFYWREVLKKDMETYYEQVNSGQVVDLLVDL